MNQDQDNDTDYKALGFMFMMLGVCMSVTFGLTLGWLFAPSGLAFLVLGLVYLSKAESEE